MRRAAMVSAALLASVQCSIAQSADPIGDQFCAELSKSNTARQHGAIYFRNGDGVPTQLRNGILLQRAANLNLFYYRNRTDVGHQAPGAILVKIIYALEKGAQLDVDTVSLFNSSQKVGRGCKTLSIERYERFHGASRERNTCLSSTFHQQSSLHSLDPVERRRAFLFGAPGIDTRGYDEAVLAMLPKIFEGHFGSESQQAEKGVSPSTGSNSYRSWLINYTGQYVEGNCLRFNPTIAPEFSGATISVVDLLETAQGDFFSSRVRDVRFQD